jgi:hypothetical protein
MAGHSDGDYTFEVDEEANRLYMTLEGRVDAETAHEALEELETAYLDRLEPGFDVVNDISGFEPISQEAARAIERGKAALGEAGASAVARVMGDSVIGQMQFERHGDDEYHVATAESREQAEVFLDRFREQDD